MKPSGPLIAERPVARHCPELTARVPQPRDRAEAVAEWLAELAEALGDELCSLLIGARPSVALRDEGAQTAASLEQQLARGYLHYRVQPREPFPRLVVSFDIATALALTDRLFGGTGKIEQDVPERLPDSAALALEQVVRALLRALPRSDAAAAAAPGDDEGFEIARFSALGRAEPFPRGDYCSRLKVELAQAGHEAASFTLIAREADFLALVARGTKQADTAQARPPEQAADDAPFAAIPLELRAELAELRLPLARLAGLQAGQVFPLALRRQVPLKVGGRRIASGTIGTIDEQVALRLTRIS